MTKEWIRVWWKSGGYSDIEEYEYERLLEAFLLTSVEPRYSPISTIISLAAITGNTITTSTAHIESFSKYNIEVLKASDEEERERREHKKTNIWEDD